MADYDGGGGGGGGGHYCTVLRLPVYRQCATVIVKPSLGEVLLSSVSRDQGTITPTTRITAVSPAAGISDISHKYHLRAN